MAEEIPQAIDFLVVGGGPAGCAFAILSARAGASVVLVERDDYKKRRPGEHLSGRIRGALDELRVSTDEARLITAASPGILSLWNGHTPLTKPYAASGQPDALCVTRHRFDELLFRAALDAGATGVLRATLENIARHPRGGWRIAIAEADGRAHDVHARSVVDASGRNAVFARSQGARRAHHGDLLAIVGWFANGDGPVPPTGMLTVESCPVGWWSLSPGADETLVATLYTSAHMMKTAGATHETWWAHALGQSRSIARTLRHADATLVETGAYPAFPSRLSKLFGDGWIAVGDAAVAFDPIAGQGVAVAMETAFRAFEAASVDPSLRLLGPDYRDALIDRFDRHLEGRALVYEEAAAILAEPFLRFAVSGKNSALLIGERDLPDRIDESGRAQVHPATFLNRS
jgi:2-polyprenyl-6-methoxyphenol hydroxylase-like FAD-dependent oxidoreductase